MKILALDDSEAALKLLVGSIREACPGATVYPFSMPSKLLKFAEGTSCDIAFLDIQIWGTTGLVVAKSLKEIHPNINVIFATAYSEYAKEAFELYPSGYILKPVTAEAIRTEIDNLRHPVENSIDAMLYAQTFGSFEVFYKGTPLKFAYSKTKELFAYLIDRNGASSNMNELCAVLWENELDSVNLKSYLRKLIKDLLSVLKLYDVEDIIIKKHNNIAIVPDKIHCDIYEFIKGNPSYVNAYTGQYMSQYTWSEFKLGYLNNAHSSDD